MSKKVYSGYFRSFASSGSVALYDGNNKRCISDKPEEVDDNFDKYGPFVLGAFWWC